MVTRIGHSKSGRLYLVEHREAKDISAEKLADRIEVTRQTVHRWEREQHRLDPQKIAAYAHALDMEPLQLWRPPDLPSVDALLAGQPESIQRQAAAMIEAWLKTGT